MTAVRRHNLKSIIICDSIHGEKLFVSMNFSKFRVSFSLENFNLFSPPHHQTLPSSHILCKVSQSDDINRFINVSSTHVGGKWIFSPSSKKPWKRESSQDVCWVVCESEEKLFHFWILIHVHSSHGWAFSMDPQIVFRIPDTRKRDFDERETENVSKANVKFIFGWQFSLISESKRRKVPVHWLRDIELCRKRKKVMQNIGSADMLFQKSNFKRKLLFHALRKFLKRAYHL